MDRLPGVLDPRDERPPTQRRLRAWLALQKASCLRPEPAVALVERLGDPGRVLDALARDISPCPGVAGDDAVARLARTGTLALPMTSPVYPARLARLPDRAPLLLVRGAVGALSGRAVAVVGARAASASGRRAARELGARLGEAGVVVISGLAYGIDAEAHLGALEGGGLTLAVQGCGPDRVYPPAHRDLAERIAARGAIVSEYPPGCPPLKAHFPHRNRLIAGMAECVVVVEARERSGSLSTARRMGVGDGEVFAMPGSVESPSSAGTNRLLRDGARVFLDADDVLISLGLPPGARRRRRGRAVSGVGRSILAALRDAPASPDQLARRLGRPPEALAGALLELELDGAVDREPDGRLRARRGRG